MERFVHYVHSHQPDPHLTNGTLGFNLRTAPDYFDRNDLVLSLAFQPTTGLTTALLLGCSNDPSTFQDPETIEPFLNFSQSFIGHPQLLLALISLLQLKHYKKLEDDIDETLQIALFKARLNRTTGREVRTSPKVKAGSESGGNIAYNEITKDVLQLYTEAGFLTQAMTQFSKLLDGVVSMLASVDLPSAERMEYHEENTIYIKAHIKATKEKILRLADSNRLATERASLLMSSVSINTFLHHNAHIMPKCFPIW